MRRTNRTLTTACTASSRSVLNAHLGLRGYRIGHTRLGLPPPWKAITTVMATLIMNAKIDDIDPQACLADVLARINNHAIHRLDELLK
jgi:IS66 C-terminal element